MDSTTPRFSIVLGQRMSWPDLLARARETEALGFDGLFLVDHFFGLFDVAHPTHEAYTMLAALAPFTQRMRLGVMVCGNTYRHPAFLLKQAIGVDHISGGRVDFGVGAGWLEREHEAYGFPFPPPRERVDRFAEALEIWDLLQRQERTTWEGTHYQLLDAPFEPKSLQHPRLPLLIGATGPRMLRLTARHADIWNTVGSPEDAGTVNRRLTDICREEGRDPGSLVRSVSPDINLLASVEAFAEGVAAYHAAGFRDIYLPWPRTEAEVPVLREVARDVLPGLRREVAPPAVAGTVVASRDLRVDDAPLVATIHAGLGGDEERENARRVLELFIDHPDERFEGSMLKERLGLAHHADVTRAIVALADAFAAHGLARPWHEAQRGYLLPADAAAVLAAGREMALGDQR
jgi:alkanesulfonate monooxygenase SsuD/methylene tetrahydromethanopterin reductase-like flavin-dependent oxidoreductase (luciferase family)